MVASTGPHPPLDLDADGVTLTAALVDVPSVSGDEAALSDLVEAALRRLGHLEVVRHGDTVLARTATSCSRRVVLAGHLDTVPIADNVPSRISSGRVYGCGASDMKAGVAVMLRIATAVREPNADLTFVFYDCEEVESERNGLGRTARDRPEWLAGDFAILLEPTGGAVEAGCQGTLRVAVRTAGLRAHSGRSWLGDNAIHRAGPVLDRLNGYQPRSVDIDGCVYREGLNAVGITGGIAGNVIPDACEVLVNYRFAPDLDEDAALDHVREVFDSYEVVPLDSAPGALPGLGAPAAAAFVERVGTRPVAKYGWTDVARFAALGIPAVNFGPGDPNLAHTRGEYTEIAPITECEKALTAYLAGG